MPIGCASARVDVGRDELLQIVCGAPNAAAGHARALRARRRGAARRPGRSGARRCAASNRRACCARRASSALSDDASGLLALAGRCACRAGRARGARARRRADHDQAHAESRRLPVACSASRAKSPRSPARRSTLPPIVAAPVTSAATRGVRIEDAEACPRFAARIIEGIDARAPTPAWMKRAHRALRHPLDLRDRRHHQLRDARARPAAARVRQPAARRRHRRALRAARRNADAAERRRCSRSSATCCSSATAAKPLGLAGIMGGEHSGIADDTTTVFLEGAFWNPAVIQGKMRRLGFQSDAGYRFERGVDFELGAARRRARDAADPRDLRRTRGSARPTCRARCRRARRCACARARVARLLGVAISPDDDRRRLQRGCACRSRAQRRRFHRHAAVLSVRSRDRGGPRRGGRAHLRLRRDPGDAARARADDAARARSAAQRRRRSSAALVARDWQEIDHVQLRRRRRRSARSTRRRSPIAVLNPIAAHLDVDAHDAAARPDRRRCRPISNASCRAFACSKSGRIFARDGFRAAAAHRRPCVRRQRSRSNGARARASSTSSTSRAISKRWPRRCRSPTTSAASCRGCIRAAARGARGRRAVGWLGELHPRLVRHFESAHGADACSSSISRR